MTPYIDLPQILANRRRIPGQPPSVAPVAGEPPAILLPAVSGPAVQGETARPPVDAHVVPLPNASSWHAPMALAETAAASRPNVEPPAYSSPMYARTDPDMTSRRVEAPPAVEPIGTASPERVPMPEMATRPVQPTGPNYTPPPAERTPGKGWKGRLASIGKGLLYGASIGAEGGGGAGAIGGALAGALGGGISPSAVARYQHERIDMPKWEHTHAREEADNQREVQQRNIEEDNRRATEQVDLQKRAQTSTEQRIKQEEDDKKKRLAMTQKAEHDLRHPGEEYGPDVTEAFPELKGKKAPARQEQPGDWIEKEDIHTGKVVLINRLNGKTREVEGITGKTLNDLTAADKEHIRIAKERLELEKTRVARGGEETPGQVNQRVQAAQRAVDKFHSTQNKLKEVDERWRNAQRDAGSADPKTKGAATAAMNKLQAEYNKLKDDTQSARESLRAHGDLIKLNAAGTYAEVQRPALRSSGGGQAQRPAHKDPLGIFQ